MSMVLFRQPPGRVIASHPTLSSPVQNPGHGWAVMLYRGIQSATFGCRASPQVVRRQLLIPKRLDVLLSRQRPCVPASGVARRNYNIKEEIKR